METYTTKKAVFYQLGKRLEYFESKKYIEKADVFYNEYGEYGHNPRLLMKELWKNSNLLESSEVYEEAKEYILRVDNILEELKYTAFEYIQGIYDEFDHLEPTTQERKEVLFHKHKKELETYKDGLNSILQTRAKLINKNASYDKSEDRSEPINVIVKLPERLPIKQLIKHFDPLLSPKQVTLLLHYFKELKIIPAYNDTSLGIISEFLFGRSVKEIGKSFTRIYDVKANTKELLGLKELLHKVLDGLEEDLKSSK